MNYNLTGEPENSLFTNENNSLERTNNVTKEGKIFIANVDYATPITETTKIEIGLESRFDTTANLFIVNNKKDANFEFNRNIQSAYGNYKFQLGKWNYQLGARLESYDVNGKFKKEGSEDKAFKDYIFTVYR